MLFEFGGDAHELLVSRRHLVDEVFDLVSVADTSHHIFALGVDEVLAHHLVIASGRVACERHTCRAVITHVAEDHRTNIDGSTQVMVNAFLVTIIHSALAIP